MHVKDIYREILYEIHKLLKASMFYTNDHFMYHLKINITLANSELTANYTAF